MELSLGSNKDQFKTEKHLKDLEDFLSKKENQKEGKWFMKNRTTVSLRVGLRYNFLNFNNLMIVIPSPNLSFWEGKDTDLKGV